MRSLHSMGLRVVNGELEILDQRALPQKEEWHNATDPEKLIHFIKTLAVRGAPLIGVSAALSLLMFARRNPQASDAQIRAMAAQLRDARPTAVNLMNCLDTMLRALDKGGRDALEPEAMRIFDEDVALCEGMATTGARFIQDGDGILTHCNTGGLATVGVGTALGVIRKAHEQGKKIHVYVDETRPLLQGARLTAWELHKLGIPYTLICDSMAASLMRAGKIQKAFTGADRIAANGDSANKIGTYGVAVLARHHRIPFYIVAPSTTLDHTCPSGAEIPIEERSAHEVAGAVNLQGMKVWNPSFDVTPRELITEIILENRLF